MKNIKTLEKELYLSLYGLPQIGNAKEIWLEIKHDHQILIQASELQMDKWKRDYILVGQTICESMPKLLFQRDDRVINRQKESYFK